MQLTNLNNADLPLKDEWDRLVAKRDYGVGRRARYGNLVRKLRTNTYVMLYINSIYFLGLIINEQPKRKQLILF